MPSDHGKNALGDLKLIIFIQLFIMVAIMVVVLLNLGYAFVQYCVRIEWRGGPVNLDDDAADTSYRKYSKDEAQVCTYILLTCIIG